MARSAMRYAMRVIRFVPFRTGGSEGRRGARGGRWRRIAGRASADVDGATVAVEDDRIVAVAEVIDHVGVHVLAVQRADVADLQSAGRCPAVDLEGRVAEVRVRDVRADD